MKKLSTAITFLLALTAFAQNTTCPQMDPICTDQGLNFTAQANGANVITAEPGNDYDCLGYSPNPTWYYLEISQSGDIYMSLTAPQDIDFIIWGPFNTLADAQAGCGSLGNGAGSVIDCSYSSTNQETPQILGAVVGQVYVMLITNYANSVQNITLSQTGGTGATDCSIVTQPPCQANVGTFTIYHNGQVVSAPLTLCFGDEFSIESNNDYVLPLDTVDGVPAGTLYNPELFYLLYDGLPTGNDPNADPNFVGIIFDASNMVDQNMSDVNDGINSLVGTSYGTYYIVPVTGDDGDNQGNPNGSVDWDKDNNGCYELGTPIEVTYLPPFDIQFATNCTPPASNGIDVTISGSTPGLGGGSSFTIAHSGDGNPSSTTTTEGGTITVNDLEQGDNFEIIVSDINGCTDTAMSFNFQQPQFQSIMITGASDCPAVASDGSVTANILNGSGQGPGYNISFDAGPPTSGTSATQGNYSAGDPANIVIVDAAGCWNDSNITVSSQAHFIDLNLVSTTNVSCYGAGDGSATITAAPTPMGSSNIVSVEWTLGGNPPISTGTSLSLNNMDGGAWTVTVTDDIGCTASLAFTITEPNPMNLYVTNSGDPSCPNMINPDGFVHVAVTGGNGPFNYLWSPATIGNTHTANNLGPGTYFCTATDQNGCTDTVTQVLFPVDSISADIVVKHQRCKDSINGLILLTNIQNTAGTYQFFWNPNDTDTSALVDSLAPGTYIVNIVDQNSCSREYEIVVLQAPPISWVPDQTYSIDSDCQILGGNGVVSGGATGGWMDQFTYEWFVLPDDSTVLSSNPTWGNRPGGEYTVVATEDSTGCQIDTTLIVEQINPIAAFTVDTTWAFSPHTFMFENESQNSTSWTWNIDGTEYSTTSFNFAPDTTITEPDTIQVCLYAYNNFGCVDSTCQILVVVPPFTPIFPNVFTPNNDGVNDLFYLNQTGLKSFTCTIFNRWGRKITVLDNQNLTWDGMINGREASEGQYFYQYTLVLFDDSVIEGQGHLALIRK